MRVEEWKKGVYFSEKLISEITFSFSGCKPKEEDSMLYTNRSGANAFTEEVFNDLNFLFDWSFDFSELLLHDGSLLKEEGLIFPGQLIFKLTRLFYDLFLNIFNISFFLSVSIMLKAPMPNNNNKIIKYLSRWKLQKNMI